MVIKRFIVVLLVVTITIPTIFISSVILIDSFINPDEVPSFFGWKPFIVLTDSMLDEIKPGDIALVKEVDASSLKEGDIIAFRYNNTTVITHRIVSVNDTDKSIYFTTKGDNNAYEDDFFVYPQMVEGIFIKRIPEIGNFAMYLQTTSGMLICMMLPIAILFLVQVIENRKAKKMINELELLEENTTLKGGEKSEKKKFEKKQ